MLQCCSASGLCASSITTVAPTSQDSSQHCTLCMPLHNHVLMNIRRSVFLVSVGSASCNRLLVPVPVIPARPVKLLGVGCHSCCCRFVMPVNHMLRVPCQCRWDCEIESLMQPFSMLPLGYHDRKMFVTMQWYSTCCNTALREVLYHHGQNRSEASTQNQGLCSWNGTGVRHSPISAWRQPRPEALSASHASHCSNMTMPPDNSKINFWIIHFASAKPGHTNTRCMMLGHQQPACSRQRHYSPAY